MLCAYGACVPTLVAVLWVLLGDCLRLGASDSIQPQESTGLKEQFLKEAPARWKEYEGLVDRFQGTLVMKSVFDGVSQSISRSEIKQNSRCKQCVTNVTFEREAPLDRGLVYNYNRKYAFTLFRRAAESPWALDGLSEKETEGTGTREVSRTTAGSKLPRRPANWPRPKRL